MSGIDSLSVPVNASSSLQDPKPRDIRSAAQQFESLLLSQILKTACPPSTLTGGEPDSASSTAVEMAQEHLASALAAQGGLGLARIAADLKK